MNSPSVVLVHIVDDCGNVMEKKKKKKKEREGTRVYVRGLQLWPMQEIWEKWKRKKCCWDSIIQ